MRFACITIMALAGFLSTGCTSIGNNPVLLRQMSTEGQFGPPVTIRLCALLDEGVSEEKARLLLKEAWDDAEESALFGIHFTLASVTRWKRTSFTYTAIVRDMQHEHLLRPGCDRVFAFVGRNFGDVVWGLLLLPEVYGAANFVHGYVVANTGSIQHIFFDTVDTLKHELLHMAGCAHADGEECYRRIRRLKEEYVHNKDSTDFFPAFVLLTEGDDPPLVRTREEANEILTRWNEYKSK